MPGPSMAERAERLGRGEKWCARCQRWLPLGAFSRSKARRDGYDQRCKECRRDYYDSRADELRAYGREWHKTEAGRESQRSARRRYYERNAGEILEHYKEWYYANHDTVRRRHNSRNREPEQRAKRVASNRRYYHDGRGREVQRAAAQRRRARARTLPATMTLAQWLRCVEWWEHRCAYCGRRIGRATMDHFIPVSRGGGTTASNIVPACHSCNSRKGNKLPREWMETIGADLVTEATLARIRAYFKEVKRWQKQATGQEVEALGRSGA